MVDVLIRSKAIFAAAVELPLSERSHWLEQQCAGSVELQQEVLSLLRAHDRSGDFLSTFRSQSEQLGSVIGCYTLVERLAEGGMGVVYAAYQTDPVRRRVALKIVRQGMDTREVISRFEAERQVLALMDHSNIARIFDGGVTCSGLPYFVMELVDGTPITEYCDQHALPVRDRVALFLQVCAAVRHAHERGIIHRDLKPTNVLVTELDGQAVPKVIDFGIAKALRPGLTDHSIHTHCSQVLGTPAYMSPEQSSPIVQDVDIRSDVYSLGVLLYELLTGKTPIDRATFRQARTDQIFHIVSSHDAMSPSVLLRSLSHEEQGAIAAGRSREPQGCQRELAGELDWITLKAIHKDRAQRYASVAALARDVQDYPDGLPVSVGPPTWVYRAGKLARRNFAAVASAVAVVLTLIIGTIVSTRQPWIAESARRTAADRAAEAQEQRELAGARLSDAIRERDNAQRVQEWSRVLLYAADMKQAADAFEMGDTPRAHELLAQQVPSGEESDLRGFEWHLLQRRMTAPMSRDLETGTPVNNISLSPDGRMVAIAGRDVAVQILDAEDFHLLGQLDSRSTEAEELAWSPDGQLIAAACADGNLIVWKVTDWSEHSAVVAHEERTHTVKFSADGRTLFSGGADGLAHAWEVGTMQRLRTYSRHERTVEDLCVDDARGLLVTAGADEKLRIWRTDSGELLHTMYWGEFGRYSCVEMSPLGVLCAFGTIKGFVVLVDPATGEYRHLARQFDGIESIQFIHGGTRVATADRGGVLQHREANVLFAASRPEYGAAEQLWKAHSGRALAVSADDRRRRLLTGGADGVVRVWDMTARHTIWNTDSDTRAAGAEPPQDGLGLLEVGCGQQMFVPDNLISVWDLEERRQVQTFAEAETPWIAVDHNDRHQRLVAIRTGEMILFDMENYLPLQSWRLEESYTPHLVALSPAADLIALTDYSDREVVRPYASTGSGEFLSIPAVQCDCLEFSPDGRFLAAGYQNDLILYDLAELLVRRGDVTRAIAEDGTEELDVRSIGERLPVHCRLTGHTDTLSDVAFSPDGEYVATVGHDRQFRMWRVDTGELEFARVSHRNWATSVRFSPDGRTLATAGIDGEVILWHTASGQSLGAIGTLPHQVRCLRFTENGRRLIVEGGESVTVLDATDPMPTASATPSATVTRTVQE